MPIVRRLLPILLFLPSIVFAEGARLPFATVFKGGARFAQLVDRAEAENWQSLPIGERTATVGKALVGTPYQSYTLEIDDHIESPSVNFNGMDCWTFFEISLGFARMLGEPRANWTPQTLLHYIELDRYRNGQCTGDYLSRLHYLEDWLYDNQRRGLIRDVTRGLGGQIIRGRAQEMSVMWRHYRYLRNNPSLLPALAAMEQRVTDMTVYHIPKSKVASIESKLQDGDIICITTRDPGGRTAHVGMAVRDGSGVLHFMHASSTRDHRRVVIDTRLSDYLYRVRSDAGIIVGRPVL